MSDAPDRIWLQWHGDGDPEWDNVLPECADVTWAVELVFNTDIPYRRDDQMCLWKQTSYTVESFSAGTFPVESYIPQCLEFTATDMPCVDEPEGAYCPYCGRRIRMEEL